MTVVEARILRRCLETLSECTDVPVTLFDAKYEIREEYLKEIKFCTGFDTYYDRCSTCRQILQFSMDMATELGSPYFFFCGSGLVMIAMPVILDRTAEGCVLVGPFSMGEVGVDLVENIASMNDMTPETVMTISKRIRNVENFTPERVQHFSDLLYMAISGCFQNWEEYDELYNKYHAQIKGADKVGKKRKFSVYNGSEEGNQELVDRLMEHISAKEKEEALEVLESLLEKIFINTSGNLDLIKLRVINIYGHLFDMAQKRGVINRKILSYKGSFLLDITEGSSLGEIEEIMKQQVAYYADEVFEHVQRERSPMMEKAVAFINERYREKISLRDLAEYLHINESYLSKLFKKEFSQNFTDYLNEVRINNSIVLMRDQSMNLLEIAGNVGFSNQSYYTKIFLKMRGVSPRQYRQELLRGNKEELE